MNKLGVLEGILFVQGDEGISLEAISNILEISIEEAKELLLLLKKSYEAEDRGLRIRFLGETFKLTTKEEHKPYFQKLVMTSDSQKLSPAALEVLAVIAYNEPITRIEIDELRGISSDYILRKLVAKGFIKEAGKSSMPGKPNLYKTTREFLDYFGLATLDDLPKLETEKPIGRQTELFTSIYKDEESTVKI